MMKKKPPISRDYLLSKLDYHKVTGTFTHRLRPVRASKQRAPDTTFNKRFAGKLAGWMHTDGYRVITIQEDRFYAHHLVWFLETNEWPTQLDHINGNPDDNRFENLRECTHGQNCMNAGLWSHNTSGVKGVSYRSANGKFYAYIKKDQKMRSLGFYDTLEEAATVRAAAEVELFGRFRRKYR